jgi:hypothetical protein
MKKIYILLAFVFAMEYMDGQTLYFEDFEGIGATNVSVVNTVTGGPMTTYDVDGLTPNANVAYFIDAWIAIENFDEPGDTVGASTSWYTPAGTSDDWMVTPQISIPGAGATLSWDAKGQDPAFPDGYQVWVSTTGNTVANLMAGTMVFEIAAEVSPWTSHSVSLDAFIGADIYIGFRNNSTDQFILLIDDILVFSGAPPFDAAINSVSSSEYSQLPLDPIRGCLADLGANVVNNGPMASNVHVQCNIYKDSIPNLVTTFISDSVASLGMGADTNLVFADSFNIVSTGFYIFEYVVFIDEADTVANNDTAYAVQFVNPTTMARDGNTLSGALGIGTGEGILGQNFTIKNSSRLLSADAFMTDPDPGVRTSFCLYATDANGLPDTIPIASTPDYVFTVADSGAFVNIAFSPPVDLAPGTYMLGMKEVDSTLTLGYSSTIFTPGTTWVRWATSPILPWANNEDFGFFVSYILRPNFDPCPPNMVLASVIQGYESNIKYEVDSMITSTDIIKTGATDILYDAGNNIEMNEGFSVELGADFEAVIDGCAGLRKTANKKQSLVSSKIKTTPKSLNHIQRPVKRSKY